MELQTSKFCLSGVSLQVVIHRSSRLGPKQSILYTIVKG